MALFFVVVFLIDFIFQSCFIFTAQLRGRYRDFPHFPYPTTCIAFLFVNISHHSGTFVTMESTLIYYYHQEYRVSIRVHFRCCGFYVLCTFTTTGIHHHSIIQSSPSALKIPWVLPVYLSLPFNPRKLLIFLLTPQFCFLHIVILLGSYTMQPFQMGFFSFFISGSFRSFHCLIAYFFLVLSNILYTRVKWLTNYFKFSILNFTYFYLYQCVLHFHMFSCC